MMLILIFFSSLAFTVLENAMSVIFHHRVAIRRRHFLVSALIPYCYIMVLGFGLLVVTVVAGALQTFGGRIDRSARPPVVARPIVRFSALPDRRDRRDPDHYLDLYGDAGGAPVVAPCVAGGVTATVLWEITRHLLVWYFSTLSRVGEVYGSLTTSIVVLLSLEVAAIVLLLGAQVIAEYERTRKGQAHAPPRSMRVG
jgi:uncharacterized BrkB/YihY/UPF0761 family membrane protein